MKKKFTMLFAALLAFAGVAKAGVTDFPTMSEGENFKWYTISNTRSASGKYLYWTESGVKDSDTRTGASLFYVTGSADACYIHNYATDLLFSGAGAWTEAGVECKLTESPRGTGLMIGFNGTYLNEQNQADGFTTWSDINDLGSIFVFEEVTDFTSVIDVPAAKESAKTTLEGLKKISALFSATVVESAIAAIGTIEPASNGLADLNTAINAINAIVDGIYAEVDKKNVRFTTFGRNAGNGGLDITAAAAGASETANSGDAGIWTLSYDETHGGFKMYNFVSNLYMGATSGQSQRVATCANFADAAIYTLNGRDANKANLLNNGNTLHANGWGSIVQWNDNEAGASIWEVIACDPITVSREQYDAAAAAKAALPYAVQQAYGLVTDAANYFSNYKSDAEGSYAALLDNAEGTYFHSAYGSEAGDGSGVHYIQADLGEGNSIDEFYFYMKPRSGNGNNRPKEITVSGSNDINGEFTEIATVTTTLDGSMTPYLSAKLGTDGTNYRYIRLTVTSTNTGTKFFTLSELYFFPADGDAGSLMESYHAFASSSITSESMASAATALINAETTLALSNIKKEVAAILAANASNHAATPALGQYSTDAYNALNTAYTAGDATQESLEAAIAAFKAAKNLPVFTIDGVISYAAGKSVYDDQNGAPNFKATNVYDKTMWWVFDQTTVTVGETESVNVVNYATRNGFWGAEALKITETSDANAEDGIFLFYTVGNGTPLHYQNDNQVIVRWSSTGSTSGSATRFTHIGNTYDLDKLTDAHIAALPLLQAAYDAKAFYADAVLGEGLGQYKGTEEEKAAIVATLAPAEAILNGTLSEQASNSVEAINAAAAAINEVAALEINLPETGKFYRFQGVCEASLAGYYITGHTNADGGRIALTAEADASTIYYFDGTNLTAYQSGLVVGLNDSHWTFASIDDNTKPASTITFAGSPRQAGKYTIKSANRYFHYTVYNNTVQVNRCQDDVCKEHDWTITEVTTLPVTITAAGYASFYAPVEVTLPEGVTAHTVTANDSWATLSEAINVVPAENGVILVGEAGTYDFAVSATGAEDLENALSGTVAKTLVAKTGGDSYYVLAKDAEGVAGLYNPTKGEDDTKFYNAGHKAYWHIPATAQSAGYRFGEGTTGIEQIINSENVVIYDLSGRRVEKMEKGIYIVNGKKVIR